MIFEKVCSIWPLFFFFGFCADQMNIKSTWIVTTPNFTPFCFEIVRPERTFYCIASSSAQRQTWINALHNACSQIVPNQHFCFSLLNKILTTVLFLSLLSPGQISQRGHNNDRHQIEGEMCNSVDIIAQFWTLSNFCKFFTILSSILQHQTFKSRIPWAINGIWVYISSSAFFSHIYLHLSHSRTKPI